MKTITEIRTVAYSPVLYGVEFLKEAIQAVEPYVEKIVILYSDQPSFGHGTNIPCPDSEEEIRAVALGASDKVQFVKSFWGHEGAHRHSAYQYCDGADVLLTFDADETFKTEDLPKAIEFVANGDKRNYGVNGYVNFWKTMDWEVKDYYRPIRFINLHKEWGTEGEVEQTIYHFGCSQSNEIMNFKYLIHGHSDELKSNWLQEKYYAWTPKKIDEITHLHPVSDSIWIKPEAYDKKQLPQALRDHSRFKLTI